MRVLLVWPNCDIADAAGVRGVVFARVWRDLGAEVVFVTHSAKPNLPTDVPVRFLRLFHEPSDALHLLTSGRALRKVIRDSRADVLVTSSPPATVAWQAARAARAEGVPLIVDVRDLATQSLRAVTGPKLRYYVLDRMEQVAYRTAARLMAVSGIMADVLRDGYHVPPDCIALVPNGSMPFDVPRREKDIDGVFVGYFHDAGRRPRDLIEALCCVHATRPGSRFAFVGWKPSPFAETLAKALREGGVRADLVPPVPREEVGPWMARAKVGLISLADHPVFRTAVGAKTYEYLRAGLPVAALGVSGDSELRRLIEGEGVGVFSADVGEFAAQLAALLSNEARLGALSQRALEVGARYDRRAIAQRAYREVVEPVSRRGA